MHAQNAKLWTVVTGLVAACPSFFCCVLGSGALFGGGTYELGAAAGQTPPWMGLLFLCAGLLPWLLPFGVWRYASQRPAPPAADAQSSSGPNEEDYSPFSVDPYHDADMSTSSTDSDT